VLGENSHLAKYVAAEVARLNEIMVLPKPVTVSVVSCGEVNAYYDPGPREITICTEMGDYLEKLARGLHS
jgi:hypothetical protein